MKKLTKITLTTLLAVASSSVLALDVNPYIGFKAGKQISMEFKDQPTLNAKQSEVYGLNAGISQVNGWGLEFEYFPTTETDVYVTDSNTKAGVVEMERTGLYFTYNLYPSGQGFYIKPKLGIANTSGTIQLRNIGGVTAEYDDTGFAMSVDAGIDLTKNLTLDASYTQLTSSDKSAFVYGGLKYRFNY